VIDHRQLGVDLFNDVWTLLEKGDRNVEDDDEMVHTAHASRFHWGKVGTAENLGRGEWLGSRLRLRGARARVTRRGRRGSSA
jgi:hypothetical protein